MSGQPHPSISDRLETLSQVAAFLSLFGGLLALAGWMLGAPLLKSFFPGQLPMKPNSIPGFILAGLSLWALQGDSRSESPGAVRRRFGQLAAILVAVIGLLAFSEYVAGWGPGLGDLLLGTAARQLPSSMTRVSLPSALNFVFIGCGLMLLEVGTRPGRRPTEYLGFATFLGGMFGILDFAIHPGIFTTGVSLISALLDCVLGCGLLCARPDRGFTGLFTSGGLGGAASRRLLPAAIVIPGVLGWLMWWGLESGHYTRDLGVILLVITSAATLLAVGAWTAVTLDRADKERWRAEEALRRQLGMNEAFFSQSVTCFALLDPRYNFIRVNEAYAKACRRKVEDFPGRNHFDLYPSDAKSIFDEVVRTKKPFQTLARPFRFEDQPERGVTFWDWTLVPVLDERGELEFLLFSLYEVTERKQAEEALRLASAYNRSLIEAARDPLVTIAPDGKITDVNSATETVTGFSREELMGTDFSGYFTEPERAQAGYQQVFREGWVQDYELQIRHRDGRVVPVLYNASVYRDEAGQVVGVFAAARDISERKRAEREMRRLNRALRTISECNQVIVRAREEKELLYGVCGIFVKEGGYRMAWIGYAEQDTARTVRPIASAGVENGYLENVQITWADDEHGRGPTGRAIRTREPSIARNTQQDPDYAPWREEAKCRGYASSIALPLILDDRPLGALMLYSQSTDAFDEHEVAMLTELAQDLAYAIRALRTKSERKAAVAGLHQLSARLLYLRDEEQRRIARELHDSTGQYLAALGMNLAWLKEQAVSLEPQSHAILEESSEIVQRCTQEIRDFSYLLHPPTLDEYGLASALRWYVERFARRSGIQVSLELPEDLRRLSHDEEIALFRVVQECLTNVHRHSGSPTARIRIVQDGKSLSLEITDEGHGFQAARAETSEGGARMGVGLLGMRERMSSLGGELRIESDGHGTTVRAHLPLEEKAA